MPAETSARAARAQLAVARETSAAADQQIIAAEAGLRGADARVAVAGPIATRRHSSCPIL
jgi:hypothetical protein